MGLHGISLKFESLKVHEKYQKSDPIHDVFTADHREMWAKALVMDLE